MVVIVPPPQLYVVKHDNNELKTAPKPTIMKNIYGIYVSQPFPLAGK